MGGGGGFKERRKVREQGEMRINTHDYNLEVLEEPQHIEAIFGREKSFFLMRTIGLKLLNIGKDMFYLLYDNEMEEEH